MIVSKLRFHSGAKRSIPRCVTWSGSRWASHNSLVIVPLLTLCFPKSSSWGCLRVLGRHLHSSAQLGLPLTKKAHYFLKHTQALFLKNTKDSSHSKGHARNGGSTFEKSGIFVVQSSRELIRAHTPIVGGARPGLCPWCWKQKTSPSFTSGQTSYRFQVPQDSRDW